jgi:hypothetical protein
VTWVRAARAVRAGKRRVGARADWRRQWGGTVGEAAGGTGGVWAAAGGRLGLQVASGVFGDGRRVGGQACSRAYVNGED